MNKLPVGSPDRPDRKTLIRDVAMFQVKLVVDGFRDLILLPASLIAGLISFFHTEGEAAGPEFYRVISVGKQSEDWIDLFGAVDHAPPELADEIRFGDRREDRDLRRRGIPARRCHSTGEDAAQQGAGEDAQRQGVSCALSVMRLP